MTKCPRETRKKIYWGHGSDACALSCEDSTIEWLGSWQWEGVTETDCSHDGRLGSREQD